MKIVAAIKSMMIEEGITQKEIAEVLGLSGPGAVSGRLASENMSTKTILMFIGAINEVSGGEWELVVRKKNGESEKTISMG